MAGAADNQKRTEARLRHREGGLRQRLGTPRGAGCLEALNNAVNVLSDFHLPVDLG